MHRTPYDPEIYMSQVDMVDAIEHYQCMRHALYSLQVALARKSHGTNAFSLCWTACYCLRDLIYAMPDDVIQEWSRLDRMSIAQIGKEEPGG